MIFRGDRSFPKGMDLYYLTWHNPVWLFLHLFIERIRSCFTNHGILNFYIRADLKSDFGCDLLRGNDRTHGSRWRSACDRGSGML